MKQYLDLMVDVLENGVRKPSRPGVDTLSVFGRQMRFDLSAGFPMVTTRKISFKTVAVEMLWFLRGEGNTKWLNENGVRIWNRWSDENGELGKIYGVQMRGTESSWRVDQIVSVINSLKKDPYGRRHIVSMWNVADLPYMTLPPCHMLFQFNVRDGNNGKILDCMMTQRSADGPIGIPHNIAEYALLTRMVAQCVNMMPGELIWSGGDVHIYADQVELAREQIKRTPRVLPKLWIDPAITDIDSFAIDSFRLDSYSHDAPINYPVAV